MSGSVVTSSEYRQVHFDASVLDLSKPYHHFCAECGCTVTSLTAHGFVLDNDCPICLPCWEDPSKMNAS